MSGERENRFLPAWVASSMADDLEKRTDRIEAMFGPSASVDEARDLIAELRAAAAGGADRD